MMDTLDAPSILKKILEKCDQNCGPHDCAIWMGATYDKKYGKIRNPLSKYKDQPTYMRTHRLLYLLNNIHIYRNGFQPIVNSDGHNVEISHLCHNSLCLNIDHLVLETHFTNCSRVDCAVRRICCGSHIRPCLL